MYAGWRRSVRLPAASHGPVSSSSWVSHSHPLTIGSIPLSIVCGEATKLCNERGTCDDCRDAKRPSKVVAKYASNKSVNVAAVADHRRR